MRWLLAVLFLLGACQSAERDVATRVRERTATDRQLAMRALTEGLNAAFITLRDTPDDRAGALAKARQQVARAYGDDAASFELFVGDGVWMLYVPRAQIWLARDVKQLITEPAQLPEAARRVLTSSASP